MSDSVGKISLDLEIQSDISKQISNVSSSIATNLKKSLSSGIKSSLGDMGSTTKKTLNNITSNINNTMKKSMVNVKKTMTSILSSIKMPKISIPKPTRTTIPKTVDKTTNVNKRGPPINADMLSSQIDNTAKALDITNAKIDQQRAKLAQLKESYSMASPARKNKMEEQILRTESSINKLIAQSDKLGFKLSELDDKMAMLGSGTNKTTASNNKLKSSLNSVSGATNKASKGLNNLGNSTKKANSAMNSHRSSIGIMARSMFTWGIMFPMILRGLQSMGTGLLNNLKTNEQFANSLAQIKSNLMIAFTPIYNFILPAINALMSALSVATQYIASFISAIFGKTFNQSKQATQGLIDAKEAMGAYGDSAKAAGKAAKDALGLAGIDEINTLGSNDDGADSGGGGTSKVPQLVTPSLDTSSVDSSMKKLIDNIKAYFKTFNFEPLIASFNKVKTAIEPIINNLGKIIKWFLVEILDPLAHWTISDLLPAFLNLLAGALNFLNPILEVFMSLGKWLWDEFLQPIASWTGGVIVDTLNWLADALTNIGNWISENKPFVEDFTLVVGSFALAWGLVTAAVAIWNAVGVVAAAVTTAFGVAIKFLTGPIGIAILAIGAIIAAGVLLYKHWDVVKAKAIEVWDFIKNKFNSFKEWLGNIFLTDWSQKFGKLGEIMNGFLGFVSSIWNSITRIFSGIIDFIAGVFTGNWERAWQGVVNIFGGIMDGLGAVIKAPLNGVIWLINQAIGGLNKIKVPDWVPSWLGGGQGINIPQIPYLARGGIIDSPTLAMVGEAGKEAVVPLENNTQGLDLLAAKLMERLGGANISSGNQDRALQIILKFGDIEFARALIDSINKLTEMNNGECLINL
ncbi:hypothetical protein [Clostridium sp.]|uniref:phage tail protein n=1 Tax=Clostridium sp. TaxID=1506 RepID=UPI001D4C7FF1|nr:hypothetical protein [Clostridium sp.]MBS5305743.1 hypothetical protein [Clostridium sp.]